ncbi:MAG: FtsX-like permease family protein [Rhodospirillaceae bacterium]|nr:FtsX-like permease family protein [Rhodospirillaceae bacterium]
MLGIIIGVAAVIVMVGVGAGAQARVEEQIRLLGSNLIVVMSGSVNQGGARAGQGTQWTISEDDAIAIQTELESIVAAAPNVRGQVQIVHGNLNWGTAVIGATPEFFEVRDWQLESGRALEVEDVRDIERVAWLGQTVLNNLFPDEDPVGTTVRIRNTPFIVAGTLVGKGQSGQGQDQDDIIVVPLSTAKKKLLGRPPADPRVVASITVKVAAGASMILAEERIRDLLRDRHQLQAFQEDDFILRNLAEIMRTQEAASKVLALLLAAVASVSLLVGGIGIMNIMLVSVTERTREIGLRMAVGARGRDVLSQFLVEAVLLSLLGGGIGVLLGLAGSAGIGHLAGWRVLIEPSSVLVSFGFAGLIGIFFGFYPARQAAALDPIEALRRD